MGQLSGSTTWIFSFPFCGPNRVNHFFCDRPPVIALVCADSFLFKLEALTATVLFILSPFLLILGSSVQILSPVFRMSSAEGKHKAFSTCSTLWLSPSSTALPSYSTSTQSSTSPESKETLSLAYTVLTPMLNLIYSLRNSEVKIALKRVINRILGPQKLWLTKGVECKEKGKKKEFLNGFWCLLILKAIIYPLEFWTLLGSFFWMKENEQWRRTSIGLGP